MTAFDTLCADPENARLHHQTLSHPFVRGIGAGSLPDSAFRHYLEQDYQFLLQYARVIALATAAAPDVPSATRLAELLHSTLAVEIGALRDLHSAFGGDPTTLDAVAPAPACRAYTDHLLECARQDNLVLTIAAILPCQWGYREIGRALLTNGLPDDPRFAHWIQEYASAEYGALVDWLIGRFNALAEQATDDVRERAAQAFTESARHEVAFWEMAAGA